MEDIAERFGVHRNNVWKVYEAIRGFKRRKNSR